MLSNHLILCRPLLLLHSIFPSIRSFPMSWLFTSGGQSIGASASASVLPMSIQGWFLLGLAGFISLQSKGLSRVFSNTTAQKHQFFSIQPSLWSNSHIHTWLLGKPYRIVNYRRYAEEQILKTYSSNITETSHPLNNNSLIPLPPRLVAFNIIDS